MRQNGKLTYLHGDQLGSASLATDAAGVTLSQQRYLPYGGLRWAQSGSVFPTDWQYTDQQRQTTHLTGIRMVEYYDYRARMYDPKIGRFISPDSIVPDEKNPQSLNRYMYTLGNPVRFTDPSGHDVCSTQMEKKDQCASESDPQPHVEDKYGNIQTQPLSSDEPAQNKPTFSQSYVKKRPYQVGNKLNKPTVEDWYYLENIKNWYGITFSGFDMYEIGQIMRAIYAIAAKMGGSGAFKDIYFGGIQFIKVDAVQFYDGCATPPCNATTSRDGDVP